MNQLQTVPASWPPDVLETFGAERIVGLPADPLLAEYDLEGRPTITLPDDAPVVKAAESLFDRLLGKYKHKTF